MTRHLRSANYPEPKRFELSYDNVATIEKAITQLLYSASQVGHAGELELEASYIRLARDMQQIVFKLRGNRDAV
jgi:hypothetical protein